jgi:hypothetical protein
LVPRKRDGASGDASSAKSDGYAATRGAIDAGCRAVLPDYVQCFVIDRHLYDCGNQSAITWNVTLNPVDRNDNVRLDGTVGQSFMHVVDLSAQPGTSMANNYNSPRSCVLLRTLEAAVVSAANAADTARTAFKASPWSVQLKDALDAAQTEERRSVHAFYTHTWMHECTE